MDQPNNNDYPIPDPVGIATSIEPHIVITMEEEQQEQQEEQDQLKQQEEQEEQEEQAEQEEQEEQAEQAEQEEQEEQAEQEEQEREEQEEQEDDDDIVVVLSPTIIDNNNNTDKKNKNDTNNPTNHYEIEPSTFIDPSNPATSPKETNPYYERVKTIFVALRQFANLAHPEERKNKFSPRITKDELKRLQSVLGYQVPDQFLAVYSRHNGHDPDHPIQYVYGGEFLSIERIIEAIVQWREYMMDIEEDNDPCIGFPKDRLHGVKQTSWNDLWLPFAISEDKSEFMCIDLDPNRASGGISGQIIAVSWYATPRQYVCPDLLTFFEYLTEKLLHGDINLHHRPSDSWGSYCSLM